MKKVFALLVVMAMLALPAAAFAQGPGYGSPRGAVQTTVQNGSTPGKTSQAGPAPAAAVSTPAPEQKGSLPFTGLQVGLVALAGMALVGTGVGLRKLGSQR